MIDLSDDDDDDDDSVEEADIDLDERVQQYLDDCEHLSDDDHSDEQQETPDYGPDDTDDDLVKVCNFKRNGCQCSMNCHTKFSKNDMYKHILNVRELNKDDKDMYIMESLGDCEKETKHGIFKACM